MGGCATKPKVFTPDDTNEAPVPAPEPTKEEKPIDHTPQAKDKQVLLGSEADQKNVVGEADYFETEKKATVQLGGEQIDKIKEVFVDDVDDKADEQTKRRSLSNLFKENENGNEENPLEAVRASTENEKILSEPLKDSIENEKILSEPLKDSIENERGISKPLKAEAVDPKKSKEESGNEVTEAKVSETQVELTPAEEFVDDDPKEALPVKVIEAHVPAVSTLSEAKTAEKKVKENPKSVSEEKPIDLKENTSENDKEIVIPKEKAMELKESAEVKDTV